MARSITLQSSSFGGDPLANLERSRAESSGKKLTPRERMEFGNRPLSDSGRRTPEPAKLTFEAFIAEESQPRRWSVARQAIEALFK